MRSRGARLNADVPEETSWYSFIYPMRVGALVARSGYIEKDEFCQLGWYFGAAFQIQDDVLNLPLTMGNTGKKLPAIFGKGSAR